MAARVTYPRERHLGMVGRDVSCDQRALHRAGVRPAPANARFDAAMVAQVMAFQHKHGLDPDGVIGPATHRALSKARKDGAGTPWPWGYYSYADALTMKAVNERLVAQAQAMFSAKDVVSLMVAAALLTVRYRDSIHYTQGELRMIGVTRRIFPPDYPQYADCSSMYTWWCYVAGAPDPNEHHDYDGEGYTGTQDGWGDYYRDALNVPLTTAIYYGYGDGGATEHVTMNVGDRLVASHGSEAGPRLLQTDYRSDVRFGRLHSRKPRPGFKPRKR